MGQKWTRVLLFSGKPLDTNLVLCCTEKLCGGTDTAPQGAHPLYRLSTASKQKIYQSEKEKLLDKQHPTSDFPAPCARPRLPAPGQSGGVLGPSAAENHRTSAPRAGGASRE